MKVEGLKMPIGTAQMAIAEEAQAIVEYIERTDKHSDEAGQCAQTIAQAAKDDDYEAMDNAWKTLSSMLMSCLPEYVSVMRDPGDGRIIAALDREAIKWAELEHRCVRRSQSEIDQHNEQIVVIEDGDGRIVGLGKERKTVEVYWPPSC